MFTVLNDEIRRLSRVMEEFDRPFDADPASLQLYKKVHILRLIFQIYGCALFVSEFITKHKFHNILYFVHFRKHSVKVLHISVCIVRCSVVVLPVLFNSLALVFCFVYVFNVHCWISDIK